MVLQVKESFKNLKKKGFREAGNKSSDHKYLHFWHNEKITSIYTKFSHSDKEIASYLIGQMSKQIHLSTPEFCDFAKCTMNMDEYIEILKKAGKIT